MKKNPLAASVKAGIKKAATVAAGLAVTTGVALADGGITVTEATSKMTGDGVTATVALGGGMLVLGATVAVFRWVRRVF